MIGPTHFIQNRYYRCYQRLVDRAMTREYDSSIHELHHPYPEAFGGIRNGRIALTFREHFLCHWLLTKFTEGRARMKMCYGLSFMRAKSDSVGTWRYEVARCAAHKFRHSPESIEKMRAAHRGKIAHNKGKPMSEDQKAKLRGPRLHARGRKRGPMPEETKAKLRKPKTPEHREKLRQATIAYHARNS